MRNSIHSFRNLSLISQHFSIFINESDILFNLNLNSQLLFVYLGAIISLAHSLLDSKFYDLLNAFKTSDDDIYHWLEISKAWGGFEGVGWL